MYRSSDRNQAGTTNRPSSGVHLAKGSVTQEPQERRAQATKDKSNVISITNNFNIEFNFLNNTFKKPHSIFFFNSNINFVGGLWNNLNK